MINAEKIAKATPRLEALIFGPGDYSASQGITVDQIGGSNADYPADIWHYARNKVIIAARAAGIEAIDGPFADFQDTEGYRTQCKRAQILGCTGKWAIHPGQIKVANELFSPTQEQVERARKLIAGYANAEQNGLGAVAIDGVMVDAATARLMRNITAKADLIGM